MSNSGFQRLARLFEDAIALPSAQREAFVARACADDAALASRLNAMLEATDDVRDPLQAAVSEAVCEAVSPMIGRQVGGYRIVDELGSGGMGTVYEAVRANADFEQHVAIKLLRLGLRDSHSLARFRRERQLLARLSHPNIAALIDGGTADDGTPWVAMELVRGLTITAHAEQARLGQRSRIALFVRLCDAVGHAHRNLVVHRDLKPANVLVTAEGEPKVLDFGIGKLLVDDAGSTETIAGAFTPSHASPEQWRGEPVTPASDVYALGIMLCELLTGELPFEPTPQRRLERRATEASTLRRPATISPLLAGDIGSILLMALREEPGRRYASASELAADLRRYLDARPVAARPDRWSYRAARYAQRHPLGLTAAAMILGLALAFVGNTVLQAQRLAEERDRALHAAAVAEASTDFLVQLFQSPDPKLGEPGLSAVDLLVRARERIAGLDVEPLVKARLYHVIGLAFGNLGEFDSSVALLRQGLAIREQVEGRDSALAADSMNRLGDILREAGRYREAEPWVLAALAQRERNTDGADPELADSYNNTGLLQLELGHYGEAAANLQRSIDMHRTLGATSGLAIAQHNLALVRLAEGDPQAARALAESALALKREAGRDQHSTYANTRSLLARAWLDGGNAERALAESDASLALRRSVLPAGHPQIAAGLGLRADVLAALGRDDEALAAWDEALAIAAEAFGAEGWRSRAIAARRALLLEARGEYADAIAAHRAAVGSAIATFGDDSLQLARARLGLGRALLSQNEAEAALILAEAHVRLQRDLPPAHAATQEATLLLARAQGRAAALPAAWRDDQRLRYRLLRRLFTDQDARAVVDPG